MARTARVKLSGEGVAYYHLMSRTNNKAFLFNRGSVKDVLMDALQRAAEFSGVEVLMGTVMDNHFHVVVEVTRSGVEISDDELVRRFTVLNGEKKGKEFEKRLTKLREGGKEGEYEAFRQRYLIRMNDISQFMKTFKEAFNIRYKKMSSYFGSIWSGRFKSTLIEDGEYLDRCMRYVLHNPIRAGLVSRVADYRWTWGTRMSVGTDPAREGVDAGTDPVYMRRIRQIGEGCVYGSEGFVGRIAVELGGKFSAKSVVARPVVDRETKRTMGYSTHGWRLSA